VITEGDATLLHLQSRLVVTEAAVRAAVEARRATDPTPDDPFRGLYLSEEDLDRLLERPPTPLPGPPRSLLIEVEAQADEWEAAGTELRLRKLSRGFELDEVDVDILLVAMAPDLDPRFERFFGYLHDDVTRRRASIGLALELTGLPAVSGEARSRFMHGPLVEAGLVEVADLERPFLTRTLQVPDRVVAHLLGDDRLPRPLHRMAASEIALDGPDPSPLGRAVTRFGGPVYLQERPGASALPLAAAALRRAGRSAIVLDLTRLTSAEDLVVVLADAVREARMAHAGLVVRPIEALSGRVDALRTATEAAAPVVLIGQRRWDPTWSEAVPIVVEVEPPSAEQRRDQWLRHLTGDLRAGVDPSSATLHFRLTDEQIRRAAAAARHQAALDGERVASAHLRAGARAQNAAGLEEQARRIEPAVGWPDLVLTPACLAGLKELANRARHRQQVIDGWQMRPGGGRGRGITSLFAGDSGTGKTMSAEVIAGDLGLDLYTVNLATVVDKYVGETEKNLERIFSEADGVNAVLLFDEADALFGKRSEVRDAHDRYANIEVAYLLQRMETFDGLAILATNLRANLDEAFARRLDAVIDFPLPDEEHRRQLWDRCLGPLVPRGDDLDLEFCARQFPLSGGNIRSIAVTAAYYAAVIGGPIAMAELMRATQVEYRKLGRLCVPSEFGIWLERTGS
jgi:ATPase family associated with various cellular activities (AAA)